MMEAVSSSESRLRENLNSHQEYYVMSWDRASSVIIITVCGLIDPNSVRFEVFTAVKVLMFFWILAPCRLVGRYQHFGETYYHLKV
jgi:hypothetical protein